MLGTYLEVTYRSGKPLAAYYHLPRRPGQRSFRTREFAPGLVVDFARGGRPLGIEMLCPERVSVAAVNRILKQLGMPRLSAHDLAPLRAS